MTFYMKVFLDLSLVESCLVTEKNLSAPCNDSITLFLLFTFPLRRRMLMLIIVKEIFL